MYRRLLSLLLVACMLIPMVCMLPLPLLAAADVNAPVYSTSFPGAGNANLPVVESDGTVVFRGNWSAIRYPKGIYDDPARGALMDQSSALISQSIATSPTGTEIWANQAHMNLASFNANYFNTVGQLSVTGSYSGAIRYTAEKTGVANITFDKIGNYAPMSKGVSAFRYGIYVNGTMVWPRTDGTALAATDAITNTTDLLAVTGLVVTAGDYIDFVCEATEAVGSADPWAGAGNVIHPRIEYLPTEEEPATEEESVLYSSSFSATSNIPTLVNGNVTFHGNWSLLSVNGTYGINTPELMTGTGTHGIFTGDTVKNTVIYAQTGGGAPAFSIAEGNWYNGIAPGQMHVPQNAAVVLRYTSEKAGYANISLDQLGNYANSGSSPVKGHAVNRYAVFVNGKMVWPTQGGNIRSIPALAQGQNEDVAVLSRYALREGDIVDFVCQSVDSAWYNTANGVGNVMFPTVSYTYLFPTTAFNSSENLPTVSGDNVSYQGSWTPMNYLKGMYLDTSLATPMDAVSPLISGGNLSIAPTHGANWNNRAHMLLSATNANYFNTVGAIAVTGMYSGGVRYVAEHSGTVDISFDQLGNYAPMSKGLSAFRYGVFLNGRMIWPVAGGTLADTESLTGNQTNLLIKTDYRINEGDILDFVCESTDAVGATDPWGGAGNVIFPRIAYTLFSGRTTSFPGADKQTLPLIVETVDGEGNTSYTIDYKGGWSATSYLRGQYANPTAADVMGVKSALGMPDAIAAQPKGAEAWVNKSHMTLSTMSGNYFKKEGQLSVTGMYSGGIRYTAEETGKIDITFDLLGNFATAAVGGAARSTEHFRYGIFLNGEMVWPVKGGTLAFVAPLSSLTNQNLVAVEGLAVCAGDSIGFICEAVGVGDSQPWDGSGNVIYPTVTYTETYDLSAELTVSATDRFLLGGSFKTSIEDALVAQAGILFDGVAYAGTRLSDGTYRVEGPAIDPKTAVDEITVRPYLRHMKGLYIYGEEIEISAAEILRDLVNSGDEKSSKQIALSAAMLHYVAELQKRLSYRTDALADDGILFLPELKGTYDVQALYTVIPLSGANVTLQATSLLLDGAPALKFTFSGAASGYVLEVSNNSSFADATLIPLQANGNAFAATLTGLGTEKWNDTYYFRVLNAANAQVSDTFTYGVSAHYATLDAQDADYGVARAMMALFEAYSAQSGGTTMSASSPAMLPNPQTGTAVSMSAAEIAAAIKAGTLSAGKVYTVSDNTVIALNMSGVTRTSGNGAVIIAPLGMTIEGQSGRLSDLTVVTGASVTLRNANGAKLDRVEIVSTGTTALTIDSKSTGVTLVDTRISASSAGATAIDNASNTLTLFHCYVQGGANAIRDVSAGNNLYEDCVLWGGTNALLLCASDSSLRYSTVYGDVVFGENCENLLVAMCLFRGADDFIRYTKVHNAVILGNDVTNVSATNSTNIYVVENRIGGQLLLDNCRYIVAEDNFVALAPVMVSCDKYNGDNITDIHARAAVGVNEDLLPHINTDAHINMPRKTGVRTVDGTNVDIASYINRNLESGKALIIAPGAYTPGTNSISIHNIENADLYAYGVLFERETIYGFALEIHHSKNVSVYGLTINMSIQSSGLVIVVEKLGNNQVRVVNGAGTRVAWNNNHTNKHESAYRWDKPYSYSDVGSTQSSVSFDANGFATFTYPQWTYEQIQVGDVITCRMADSLTYLYYNENILFEDVSVLGGTVRCFWDDYAEEGTTLNRVVDMPMPSKVIDKATYDRYKSYEATYGIYTGVYIDEFGNYRGTAARTATADFAHSSASRTGFKVSHSIVSGLSDDGTNNQGYKDRVAGYDPLTGTLTVRDDNGWGYGLVDENAPGSSPTPLVRGEEVLIYTSTGKLIAKTNVLSDSVHSADGLSMTLTIPKSAIPENAFAEFDLSDGYSGAYKVLIHSLDRMGDEVRFDNVRFENIRSRGNLLKSDDIIIKNCSFFNIGMAAIGMQFEIRFGESGFLHDVIIENNYMENTGYFNNYTYYSPITVDNPAVKGTDEYLISSNITIRGNVIRNRGTSHALFLRGVRDVVVENNDFGSYTKQNGTKAADVFALFVKNVNFSGNTYSAAVSNAIICSGHRGISGSDLTLSNDRTLNAKAIYALEEQRPYLNGSTPAYVGNWSAGYMGASAFSYTQYGYVNAATNTSFWFIQGNTNLDGKDAWYEYGYGGMATVARDYRFLPSNGYHSAFRYTMDRAATVAVSLSTFYPPYADTSQVGGSADGLFAIFVNGNMVWPTSGGSYTSASSWYPIDQETSQAELNRSLASLTLNLSAGDQIYFVGRRANASERTMFSAVPVVYYL